MDAFEEIERDHQSRREAQAQGGKLGGSSRSRAKKASSSANLALARARRWPGHQKLASNHTGANGVVEVEGSDHGNDA